MVIKVVDNGIGIPREHLKRVFDPFFTTKPAGAGVGLGLSLCQRMILSNQGTIRVESEVGRGTASPSGLGAAEESSRAQQAAEMAHPERSSMGNEFHEQTLHGPRRNGTYGCSSSKTKR